MVSLADGERVKILLANGYLYVLKAGEEAKLDTRAADGSLAYHWLEVDPAADPLGAPLEGQHVQLASIVSWQRFVPEPEREADRQDP